MKHQKGFTLAELITAIVILGILATLAAPSFREVIQNNRLTGAANSFLSGLALVRSEAIKRNQRVVLCKSSDGERCDTSSTGFEQGWLVFVDCDNDADFDKPGGNPPVVCDGATADIPLRVQDAMTGDATLLRTSGIANSVDDYISYLGSGRARGADGRLQNSTLWLCQEPGPKGRGRKIVINTIGRARIIVPQSEAEKKEEKDQCRA